MNRAALGVMLAKRSTDWRMFWCEQALEYKRFGFRFEVGGNWATVRDEINGKLLDSFVIETTRSEISGRLAQLLLDKPSSNNPTGGDNHARTFS